MDSEFLVLPDRLWVTAAAALLTAAAALAAALLLLATPFLHRLLSPAPANDNDSESFASPRRRLRSL